MRRLLLLSVAISALVHAAPVQAADMQASAAMQNLQSALGSNKIVGNADGAEIISALETAAYNKPALLQEMATLVVVARPDLMANVKASLHKLTPHSAEEMIKSIEAASANPTVDQLAAIATSEGVAPAAGDSSSTDSPSDDTDLGWAGFGGGTGDGSSN